MPAALRQALGHGRAGDAGPDHDGVPAAGRRGFGLRPPRRKAAAQHFALAPEARAFLHGEAGGFQCLAHRRRARIGGECGAGARQLRDPAQQLRRPHVLVEPGRKTVEINGVGAQAQPRHGHGDVGECERQREPPGLELQAVHAGEQRWPRLPQLPRERLVFSMTRVQRRQRIGPEWMLLDRDIVQALAACRIGAPLLPGGKKIQPGAETGFEYGEYAP